MCQPGIKGGVTVRDALRDRRWVRDISGALTVQVILEYLHIWDLVMSANLVQDVPDRVLWRCREDQQFTTASAYQAFFYGQYTTPGERVLCKSRAPNKCKIFLWLALQEGYWTAYHRKRHGLQDHDTCAIFHAESETITHLLVTCSYSREVWTLALTTMEGRHLTPSPTSTSIADWWSTDG